MRFYFWVLCVSKKKKKKKAARNSVNCIRHLRLQRRFIVCSEDGMGCRHWRINKSTCPSVKRTDLCILSFLLYSVQVSCLPLSANGTWWHTRRNQIRSSSETDGSIYIGGGVSTVEYWLSWSAGRGRTIVVTLGGLFRVKLKTAWLPTPFASFPFTSPPVRRRVPPDSVSTLPFDKPRQFQCASL